MQGFDARFDALESRMDGLDRRMDALERRVEAVARRVDALDAKVDRVRDELAGRLEGLEVRMATQFRWLVGIQIAVLLAVVAALAGG